MIRAKVGIGKEERKNGGGKEKNNINPEGVETGTIMLNRRGTMGEGSQPREDGE